MQIVVTRRGLLLFLVVVWVQSFEICGCAGLTALSTS